MFIFKVDNQNIKLIKTTPLVSHTVKEYQCQFIFDESWAGYIKTAIFMTNDSCEFTELRILNDDNICEIPSRVLIDGGHLRVGIYGEKESYVRPTIYSSGLLIRKGAYPCGDGIEPEPGIYEQIIQILEETKEIAQSVRDDADAGKFDGKDGIGVPEGGTAGQVLAKKTDANYDTEWVDQTGGGGGPFNHIRLINRDKPNQHPIGAITGLHDKLTEVDDKLSKIPKKLSELESDAEHQTVTETEKEKWNKSGEGTVKTVNKKSPDASGNVEVPPDVSVDDDPILPETILHINTKLPELNLEVPTELSELNPDTEHQTVSKREKDAWIKSTDLTPATPRMTQQVGWDADTKKLVTEPSGGGQPKESQWEHIERILFGYEEVKTKPDDWDTSFQTYFKRDIKWNFAPVASQNEWFSGYMFRKIVSPDVAVIKRSDTPSGEKYKFQKISIYWHTQNPDGALFVAQSSIFGWLGEKSDRIAYGTYTVAKNEPDKVHINHVCSIENGTAQNQTIAAGTAASQLFGATYLDEDAIMRKCDYINGIELKTYNRAKFADGDLIDIYGVKRIEN